MENKTDIYYPSQKTIDKARDKTSDGLKMYEEISQAGVEWK